jgi:hypothetical protein
MFLEKICADHSSPVSSDAPPRPLDDGQFTGTEWEVVEMARWDGLKSLHPGSLLCRVDRLLFGLDVPLPLANERLETLRCFAVKTWCRTRLRGDDLRPFFEAGFTRTHVRSSLDHVAGRRGFAPAVDMGSA